MRVAGIEFLIPDLEVRTKDRIRLVALQARYNFKFFNQLLLGRVVTAAQVMGPASANLARVLR